MVAGVESVRVVHTPAGLHFPAQRRDSGANIRQVLLGVCTGTTRGPLIHRIGCLFVFIHQTFTEPLLCMGQPAAEEARMKGSTPSPAGRGPGGVGERGGRSQGSGGSWGLGEGSIWGARQVTDRVSI